MATPKATSKEDVLKIVMMQAVVFGHLEAVVEAAEALKQYFPRYAKASAKKVIIKTGPQMLDFIVTQDFKVPAEYKSLCKTHSPLMVALALGKLDIAKKLIELEASVAFKNKEGMNALHITCNKGMTGMVTLLLDTANHQKQFCYGRKKTAAGKPRPEKTCDCEDIINAKMRLQGWTPLMYAVKGGHVDTVRELVRCEFLKYDVKNRKQQNVCHVAAREAQLECLQLLHEKSGDGPFLTKDGKDWNLLHQVCCKGNVEIFKWLLETIPQLNTRESLNQASQRGKDGADELSFTPLLVACMYKKGDIVTHLATEDVKDLVDFGALCHRKGERGMTALHFAASHDDVAIAKTLVTAGCPLNVVDKDGNNVFHMANMMLSSSFSDFLANDATTKAEWKEMEKVRNDNKDLPSEVEEKFICPLEIKKRGPEAVALYRQALAEGRGKIPYCGLLILGKEKVGKTSLYRQLVKKHFIQDLDSTRGIDNNTVDTVERRQLDPAEGGWKEKEKGSSDVNERFSDGVANDLLGKLPELEKDAAPDKIVVDLKEEELLKQIRKIVDDIDSEAAKVKRDAAAALFPTFLAPRSSPKLHRPAAPILLPDRPRPPREHRAEDAPRPSKPKASPVEQEEVRRNPRPKPAHSMEHRPPRPAQRAQPERTPTQPVVEESLPSPPPQGVPTVKRGEGAMISDNVKDGKKKEPSLLFNALDFAGQKMYRPMHYCFISRRALYVVVFKIPDMLAYISKGVRSPNDATVSSPNDATKNVCSLNDDPIEEVRYWIHSIHARIYPPDEKGEDKKLNRVFLVGTHLGKHSTEDLCEIKAHIKKSIITDDCCSNHVVPVPGIFFAVENSVDYKKSESYLKESGTEYFQEAAKAKCADLPFLREDYPLKWLKFEDRLELCDVAIMSLEDVKKLAIKSGITDEDMQELALNFFHDTGKIICLKYLPCLFVSADECEQLAGYVVLRPQWLMSVMQVIMELTSEKDYKHLEGSQVGNLERTGIASLEILETRWKKFLPSPSDIELRHLCLILQAYCLIYPHHDVHGADTTDTTDTSDSTSATAGGDGGSQKKKEDKKYIIPCKLPDDFQDPFWQNKKTCTFYFDFEQFLPVEIYHKLICLASTSAKPPYPYKNKYSYKKCSFYGLENAHWVMEIDPYAHRLKIMIICKGKERPIQCVQFIHKLLTDICNASGLKGLVYHGSPEKRCGIEGCEGKIMCVRYVNGKDEVITKPSCPSCFEDSDVNSLLYSPRSCDPTVDTPPLLGIDDVCEVYKAVFEIAADWEFLGLGLCLPNGRLKAIKQDESTSRKCLKLVVESWLTGTGGERSWKFLCEAIRGKFVENPALADKISKQYNVSF